MCLHSLHTDRLFSGVVRRIKSPEMEIFLHCQTMQVFNFVLCEKMRIGILRDHQFSTYAKFSEKLSTGGKKC